MPVEFTEITTLHPIKLLALCKLIPFYYYLWLWQLASQPRPKPAK